MILSTKKQSIAAIIARQTRLLRQRTITVTAMAATAPMPSCLPPQLIIAWLPIRDVGAALRVSKDWCAAPEPIFQAIAVRHGLRLQVLGSWRATVRRYRGRLGCLEPQDCSAIRLITAAQRNDVPAIQDLISDKEYTEFNGRRRFRLGVDVNYTTGAGQTGLHIAAMWGNLDVLNALIAAGADLNAQNWIERTENGGGTPLHSAANSTKATLSMRYVCARRLIEAGANARLLNGEEAAPYESPFPEHESDVRNYDLADIRVRFRKLLKFAFRAHRCLA